MKAHTNRDRSSPPCHEIVNEAEERGEVLDVKPVQLAVEEFASGYPRTPIRYIGSDDEQ